MNLDLSYTTLSVLHNEVCAKDEGAAKNDDRMVKPTTATVSSIAFFI
ncbi:MAG: hypothetical protein WAM88_11250 [Nitrososphaeraceae archaeon]